MAREVGTYPISEAFEVNKEGTVDARQMVDNFSDLLAFTSANFIDRSFFVSVRGIDTPSEIGLYLCVDKNDLSNPLSWQKLGENLTPAQIVTLLETLEGTNRLDASAIKNITETIDTLLGSTDWRTGGEDNLGASNGIVINAGEYQLGDSYFHEAISGDFKSHIDFQPGFIDIRGYEDRGFARTDGYLQLDTLKAAVGFINQITGGNVEIQLVGNGALLRFVNIANPAGLIYQGFGETNETGVGADYTSIPGIGLLPRKAIEDLIDESTSNGLFPPVANITDLKAINTSTVLDYPDRWLIHVESEGIYALDRQSTATGDDNLIVTPSVGTGRWIKKTNTLVSGTTIKTINGHSVLGSGNLVIAGAGGDMLASTYDPQNIAQDAFDRANFTGQDEISDVNGLQAELDSLLKKVDAETGETIVRGGTIDVVSIGGNITLNTDNGSVVTNSPLAINNTVRYTAGQVPSDSNDLINLGFSDDRYIPKLSIDKIISDANYTVESEDLIYRLIFTNPCTVTLPNTLPKGFQFEVRKDTAGDITFTAEGTFVSTEGNVLTGDAGIHAYIYKNTTTEWRGIFPGAGGSGGIQDVIAGTNITIDKTDPANPIINATGGGGSGDMLASVYDPQSIADDAFDLTNHTGNLPINRITNLQSELDEKVSLTGNQSIDGNKIFLLPVGYRPSTDGIGDLYRVGLTGNGDGGLITIKNSTVDPSQQSDLGKLYVKNNDLMYLGGDGNTVNISNLSSGTSYTDQQAREANESLASTGSEILFDRPRDYGTDLAPITATILTDNNIGAKKFNQKIYHQAASFTPPASWVKITDNEYVPGELNLIFVEYERNDRKIYSIL